MAKHNGYGGGFGGGNMQNMLRQAQKIQEEMQAAQAKLQETEFEGNGGGELVKVVMTGDKNVVSVTIKPEAVDPDDIFSSIRRDDVCCFKK